LDLLSRIGTPGSRLQVAVTVAGLVELFFSFLPVALWRYRWPLWATLGFMLVGIPAVAITAPTYLRAAFNPLTLNLAVAALAAIAIIAGRDLPSATRCCRIRIDPDEIDLRTGAGQEVQTPASAYAGTIWFQQYGRPRIDR